MARLLIALLAAAKLAHGWTTDLPKLTDSRGPVVNLGYAAYVGNNTSPAGDGDTSVEFYGHIPYAQSPLGDLRFRRPAQLDETIKNNGWVDVEDARTWGKPCLQQPANASLQSEDCLLLNIWKPSWAKPGDDLAVVLYIYGGGFFNGDPSQYPMYDWVHQTQDVIAVNIAYRLNLLGFLGSHFVAEDGDLNIGLLDQRAAIEWVARNIWHFGGNGKNITIVGESAGGASVMLQLTAYGGERGAPFQGAVCQSIGYGPVLFPYEYETYFENVTAIAGCKLETGVMDCLRKMPLETVVQAINVNAQNTWAPIVDGEFLPALASELIPAHRFSKEVKVMAGHCTNDGRTFAGSNTSVITAADIIPDLEKRYHHLSNETKAAALELYLDPSIPGSPYATQYDRAAAMHQDIEFGCMDWYLTNHTFNAGQTDSFNFRWNVPNPVALKTSPYIGVGHASDVFFMFSGTGFIGYNATEKFSHEELIGYWTSFARTGNPSTYREKFSPEWENWGSQQRMVMTEDINLADMRTASGMEPFTQDYIDKCLFWMLRGNETRV